MDAGSEIDRELDEDYSEDESLAVSHAGASLAEHALLHADSRRKVNPFQLSISFCESVGEAVADDLERLMVTQCHVHDKI